MIGAGAAASLPTGVGRYGAGLMATAKRDGTVLPPKTRVVATKDLVGVPMGTPGRIEVVNGLTWMRYWVQFDNEVWLGSVDAAAVVAEDEWPLYQLRRAEAEARAAEEAARPPAEATPAAAAAPAADADTGASSKIPAALLARSQAAKAKKAAAASE